MGLAIGSHGEGDLFRFVYFTETSIRYRYVTIRYCYVIHRSEGAHGG